MRNIATRLSVLTSVIWFGACSGNGSVSGDGGGSTVTGGTSSGGSSANGGSAASSSGGASSGGTSGGVLNSGGSAATGNSGGSGGVDECAAVSEDAIEQKRPMDIIFVIDNSSSMDAEITEVQDRINQDFADIIEASDIDYRVIMFARYGLVGVDVDGSDNPVCIASPLGGHDCSDPETQGVANTNRFKHYSADVESRDAWCRLLDCWDKPDECGLIETDDDRPDWEPVAPNGWSQFLREGSFKTFVMITDDRPACSVTIGGNAYAFDDMDTIADGEADAAEFDAALLDLSPEHFGTAEERNYNFYSIVGMSANDPATTPWDPSAPIQTGRCEPMNESEAPGTGYQALSISTDALRYPICQNQDFDAIFEAIAQGIIDRAELACEWEIPDPPKGETFDKDKVNVEYTPGGSDEAQIIAKVAKKGDCNDDGGWYYDDESDPQKVFACPATCDVISADGSGNISIAFGCATKVNVPK